MNNIITSYIDGTAQEPVTVAPDTTFRTCQSLLQAGTEYISIRRDIDGSVARFFNVQDEEIFEIANPFLR